MSRGFGSSLGMGATFADVAKAVKAWFTRASVRASDGTLSPASTLSRTGLLPSMRFAPSRADRQTGRLIAMCSLLFFSTRVPNAIQQIEYFAHWWSLLGGFAVAVFSVLTLFGSRISARVLWLHWIVLPALIVFLQLAAPASCHGEGCDVAPWIWSLEPASVSLFMLVVRPRWAFVFALVSAASVAVSSWLLTGSVPRDIVVVTPPHLSNVAFVAIFLGIRNRLARMHESENMAKVALDLRAQVEEADTRQRELGRWVHDEILSVLTSSRFFSDTVPQVMRDEAAKALSALDRFTPTRDESRVPGTAALKSIGERLEESDIATHVALEADDSLIPAHVVRDVSAALAEALRNARNHAFATEIRVSIKILKGGLSASLSDNGIGMRDSPEEAAAKGRLGLAQSVFGRVQDIGGTVRVVSTPGQGTEIRMVWGP